MKTTIFKTRKLDGGTYKFNLHMPSYDGEKGVLGVEITPYITVTTPENSFGYTDTFFYSHKERRTSRSYPDTKVYKLTTEI